MQTDSDIRTPETLEELERYWTDTLMPFAATQGLPPDWPRAAGHSGELLEVELPVDHDLSSTAIEAGQSRPSRLLAMVLAASAVLLHRLNDVEQVCILTPVAESGPEEGGTNRWLALKNEVSAEEELGALLEKVRKNLAAAYSHQQYPFARLLEMLGHSWPVNRAPLSDLAVAFDEVSRMDVLSDVAVDLTVLGSLQNGSLSLRIRYRADLFAEDTVLGFGRHLVRMIGLVLRDPHARVGSVHLLQPEEEAAAIEKFRAWNNHSVPPARVEDLILGVAEVAPQEIALACGTATLTYRETISRAQALAGILQKAGIVPGDRVAVALDSGLHLPVALIGILLSGAAFVPLDPRHPASRLQGILKQVKPAAVLAETRLHATLEGLGKMIEWAPSAPYDPSGYIPIEEADGHKAPAYVMFTSGSTGEPNGVEITHYSFVNYLLWAKAYYLGNERPGFAFYSSIAFDMALTSVFLPLIAGCQLVIFRFEEPVVDMNAVLADPRIGIVKATPSHLKLLRISDIGNTSVRRLILGGEAFELELAESLQKALGPAALIFNEYGPTEATIACTAHRFSNEERRVGTVAIGAAIWNTGIYLLDQERRPVPAYMPGELWISGVPLSIGYLNRADLTNERFVQDPFNEGQRMYATGDRARCDVSGTLYYIGRRDHQVKFKGIRIELNEIRAALNRLARVRDSIIRIVEDERRNQVMIAYYVARQNIDVSIIRAGLLELLPQEMIPNLFVRMPKLPLTLNGKIDTDRLPSLEEVRKKTPQTFVVPNTETQKAVASVWSEVLGVAEISVHSNFFELGGHSLLASQVAWKISERLGLEVPLRLLFDAPTIGELAAILDERGAATAYAGSALASARGVA